MTAGLPEGWTVDEEPQAALPPGWKVEEEKKPAEYRDVVSENLRAQGYEPDFSEELERATESGMAETYRGILSGLSFGLTENVPGLKTEPNFASTTGKVIGSIAPISKLLGWFGGSVSKLASKSPIFQKQLSSLANLMGIKQVVGLAEVGAAGATSKALETITQGELPSPDDLLEHGVEWAALDAILQTAGAGGKFAYSLLKRSSKTGQPAYKVLNDTVNQMRELGEEFTTPEIASAKALEILERPITEAELQSAKKIELPKAQETPVEGVAKERFNEQPVTPKQLKDKKVNDEAINRLGKESVVLSEPYQPQAISFVKEAEALENTALESRIDSVAPRAASEQELGVAIREDIESQLQAEKEAYKPLYEEAEQAAAEAKHVPKNTAREAGQRLVQLSRIKTKPAGYSAVINNLETVLEDAGFTIQRNEAGQIEQIISTQNVPVENTMELARRLNEIIDYEAVEPTVKNALKLVARAAKQDVRAGLASNPDALAAFELAEAEHARVAAKYAKDSIRKIRSTEAGERISSMTNAATTVEDLKSVLSPKQMLQVEREILEKLNNQTFEKAQKQLREVERHLSAENRKLAQEIVEAKNPHNPSVRRRVLQDSILSDMSNAFNTWVRPEKTLNLWKTPKGQKIIQDTFEKSPNWNQVKSYLEHQSFNDMVSSVLKDGKLDIKKLDQFMKDQATVNNIRMLGGEEAVQFFKTMDTQVKQLHSNLKLLDRLPTKSDVKRGKELLQRTKQKAQEIPKSQQVATEKLKQGQRIKKETTGEHGSRILERMVTKDFPVIAKTKKLAQWFTETMGLNERGLMTVFGLMKLGIPNTVLNLIGYRVMNRLATSPKLRKAFLDASKHYTDPVAFMAAFDNFAQMEEES